MIVSPDAKRCFIARPVSMHEELRKRYRDDQDHWQHVHDHLLAPAVEAAGYQPIAPTSRGSNLIHADIIRNLNDCDLVLADVSTLNPNVLFEAGVRTSINKPLVLVAEHGTSLPFDIGGINTVFYDEGLDPWTLKHDLDALTTHIEETELDGNSLWRGFGVALKSAELRSSGSPEDARLELITLQLDVTLQRLEALELLQRNASPEPVNRDGKTARSLGGFSQADQPRRRSAMLLLDAAKAGVFTLHTNEQRVLEAIADGLSTEGVAEQFGMTPKVVLMHHAAAQRRFDETMKPVPLEDLDHEHPTLQPNPGED